MLKQSRYENKYLLLRLEAFTATELDKIFWGNKPCQLCIKAQRFGDHQSPDEGGGEGLRNVGLLSTADTDCCPKRFYEFF
jgi:hypothetical protein